MSCALQVSFVNSIATSKGGGHINEITDWVSRIRMTLTAVFAHFFEDTITADRTGTDYLFVSFFWKKVGLHIII